MVSRFCLCWFLGLLILFTPAFSQEIARNFSTRFTNQQRESTLFMGGNVDFNNTFVYLTVFPKNYQAYQNLETVVLKNHGNHPLKRPFIAINNSGFWWEPSDIEKDIELDSNDFDNSALLLWGRINDRVLHRSYPYNEDAVGYKFRAGTPIELTSVFGYGICYNNSSAIARLPSNENNFFYSLAWDKHATSEYKKGNRSAIIDTDLKTFYRDLSNNKLSNRSAISNDRYLIRRTHHYGRQYMYDKRVNEYIANLYAINNEVATVAPEYFSLDYSLLPGEAMILDYGTAAAWYSEDYYDGTISELANGRFTYDWNSSLTNSLVQPNNLTNLQIDQWLDAGVSKSRLIKTTPNQSAGLNFSLQHGFQVVFFELTLDFDEEISTSDVSVQLSSDSAVWIMPMSQVVNGNHVVSKFDLQTIPFRGGEVHVRILINEEQQIAISNFSYTSYFQINRLALPQLKCGDNVITMLHDSQDTDIDLQADFTYKEKTDISPAKIENPLYPKDKETVYGHINKILWPKLSEDVVNYEFLLTTDTIKELPLAPNFIAYTNGASIASIFPDVIKDNPSGRKKEDIEGEKKYQINPVTYINSKPKGKREDYFQQSETARKKDLETTNEFIINEEGFLNSDHIYFWKVRPLNADGIWGPWSNYFSFTIKKAMPPVNLQMFISENDEILSWDENTNGVKASKFEVYASDEYMGFEPSAANLWATTESNQISILNCPHTFFRVIAVDSLGYSSEASEYVNRAYPYLTSLPQQIYADSTFEFKFSFNPLYIPFVSQSNTYYELTDEISLNIVKMPAWLVYNSSDSTVTGKTTEEVLKKEFYAGKNLIELEVSSRYLPIPTRKIKVDLDYQIKNNSPFIEAVNTVVFTDNEFSFSVNYSDADMIYGDSVSLSLDNQPAWLHYDVADGKVLFSGFPTASGESRSRLIGHDKFGDTTSVDVIINVVSNTINYTVAFTESETLKLELKSLPFHESLIVDSLYFSLGQIELTDYEIQLIDNELIIAGDFCLIKDSRLLMIPVSTEVNGGELRFQIALNLYGSDLGNPILAYHPIGSSNIILENLYCGDLDVQYWIIDINGRILMKQEIQMSQQEISQVSISELSQGIYMIHILSQGKQVNFKFLKT